MARIRKGDPGGSSTLRLPAAGTTEMLPGHKNKGFILRVDTGWGDEQGRLAVAVGITGLGR